MHPILRNIEDREFATVCSEMFGENYAMSVTGGPVGHGQNPIEAGGDLDATSIIAAYLPPNAPVAGGYMLQHGAVDLSNKSIVTLDEQLDFYDAKIGTLQRLGPAILASEAGSPELLTHLQKVYFEAMVNANLRLAAAHIIWMAGNDPLLNGMLFYPKVIKEPIAEIVDEQFDETQERKDILTSHLAQIAIASLLPKADSFRLKSSPADLN